jgi:hypothetical protein
MDAETTANISAAGNDLSMIVADAPEELTLIGRTV